MITLRGCQYIVMTAIAAALMVTIGCASTDAPKPATSGNPAADMRAQQRVDDDGDSGERERGATLFQRIGGESTIRQIVNDVTDRVLADPRVNFTRKDVKTSWLGTKYDEWKPTEERLRVFKKNLSDFLTLASGGPAEYRGRTMEEAHDGMRITNTEFDAFVGDLTASMQRLGIGTEEQRDLLAIVESTRKQIVEEP